MNIRQLFLASLVALSASSVYTKTWVSQRNSDNTITTSAINSNTDKFIEESGTAVITGSLVGGFTGTSIGYLANTLFDAIVNQQVVNALTASYADKKLLISAAISLARVGAVIGSKWYWEKPLRNKIMNWLITAMKEKGITFNEELMKTTARVTAWLGSARQITFDRAILQDFSWYQPLTLNEVRFVA